ncbi:MAG: Endoribonuclease [Mycobacterium sp.]|nr:Endoribonuclease [Mycobacterium sp.]
MTTLDAVNSAHAFGPTGPFSHAIVHNGLVFVGGQGPFDVAGRQITGDIATQFRATMDNIVAILTSAGTSLERVLKVNIFVSDLAHLPALNTAYREVFAEPFPVRTAVQVGLPGFDVEIDIVAALDA